MNTLSSCRSQGARERVTQRSAQLRALEGGLAIVSSAHPYDRKRNVTLLVPCYNEAESIGKLIASVPRAALSRACYSIQVVVIDNNSED